MGRSVSIHLFNNSSVILTNPQVHTHSGYCVTSPQLTVEKGATVKCAFGKTAGTACGAVGVLTYDINEGLREKAVKRLAIMFSVPYDYSLYENWFALGLFETETACDEGLFQLMYYRQGPQFQRGKGTGSEVRFQGEKYTLRGTMSPAAEAEMRVEVRHEPIDLKAGMKTKMKTRSAWPSCSLCCSTPLSVRTCLPWKSRSESENMA